MHTLFATHSGKLIDLSNIKEEDICLEDIAHHLTKIQRFGGSLPLGINYSVASHSLKLCQYFLVQSNHSAASTALMHDASEAYLGDITTGLKNLLPEYKEIEKKLTAQIMNKYRINQVFDEGVKLADKQIMLDEVYYLNRGNYFLYSRNSSCSRLRPESYYPNYIKPDKYPERIKQLFLDTCEMFGIKD